MRVADLILRKMRGEEHSSEEIEFLINGYLTETIPDYQMSAWLMAVCWRGLNPEETAALTFAYIRSGETLNLKEIPGIKVDKHSTGGVGDKLTLILLPLMSALGVPVAKMSGRGLGYTGGTLDKLSSIPGFRANLSQTEFLGLLQKQGLVLSGQTANLVPADKKLYALRDVTATVESRPLIAASVMSKKIASGADALVLDVKVGSGAFMKDLAAARSLAETMVNLGHRLGRKTVAVLTSMEQPLGRMVGNVNEVQEAIAVLQGGREAEDVREIALHLAAQMAVLGGKFKEVEEAAAALSEILAGGQAYAHFEQWIAGQGGDLAAFGQIEAAAYQAEVKAEQSGWVSELPAEKIGLAALQLGAGRELPEDEIDLKAGICLKKKVGEAVQAGETLAILQSSQKIRLETLDLVQQAYHLSEQQPPSRPLIYETIAVWKDFYRCSL